MTEFNDQPGVGGELGDEATHHVERRSEDYCAAERQRIEVANQPKILALHAKIAALEESTKDLEDRIRVAPPMGEVAQRKKNVQFYSAITILLTIAGFLFSIIAFDPFQLGWKAWLYCAGIAVVTPFLVEKSPEIWASARVVKTLTTIACISALLSIILLAVIRGDLLTEQLSRANPVAEMEGDAPPQESQSSFYEHTLGLLRIVMALLALAMEVGAGIAFYEARRWSGTGEDANALRERLAAERNEMIELAHECVHLENEADMFERRFWRDFYRSLLNGVKRSAVQKLPVVVLGVLLLTCGRAFAADHVDVVTLIDLTLSVDAPGHDGKTEFEKNVNGVTEVLASLPAGSRIAVYGITNNSFGAPYALLTASLSDDEGYFKERLVRAHTELIHAWQKRALTLQPQCPQTDILGAFMVASQRFAKTPSGYRKVLIIFSDMRQATPLFNLDRSELVPKANEGVRFALNSYPADLHGVEVYALGADAMAFRWRTGKACGISGSRTSLKQEPHSRTIRSCAAFRN